MHRLVTVLLALLLAATGAAYALHVQRDAAAEPSAEPAGHDHADHDHGGDASREARLQRASFGEVPTLASLPALERHGAIVLRPDVSWSPALGVDGGSGTPDDPYVIDGVHADLLLVADTAVDFEVRNSWIRTLVLDWHGDNGLVHHNRIESLRTNRNVERVGGPSGAVIAHNVIDEITQLRHFDGVVTGNVIGREDSNLLDRGVAFDLAGFNGAEVTDNVVYGGFDVKLHGHHHDDGSGGSHNHGAPDDAQNETRHEAHEVRHHRLLVRDNVIVDPLGFGLRYNDLNHAGDDRQATSEQEPALETPHAHWTHVEIVGNTVDGAPLRVEIFNAKDELHTDAGHGELVLAGNRVVNATVRDGVFVAAVENALVRVEDNVLTKALGLFGSVGVRALAFENSTLVVRGNEIDGFRYGVYAENFDDRTFWFVEGNRIVGAQKDVMWDGSVANPPEGHGGGHEHDEGAAGAARRALEARRAAV